jgi:hypothetical protein
MWPSIRDDPPSDPGASEIRVTLSGSGPLYVSSDAEFAVLTAALGEARDGAAVRVGFKNSVRPPDSADLQRDRVNEPYVRLPPATQPGIANVAVAGGRLDIEVRSRPGIRVTAYRLNRLFRTRIEVVFDEQLEPGVHGPDPICARLRAEADCRVQERGARPRGALRAARRCPSASRADYAGVVPRGYVDGPAAAAAAETRAAVLGTTADGLEPHFRGGLGNVDPDELFAFGEAWGIEVVRRAD